MSHNVSRTLVYASHQVPLELDIYERREPTGTPKPSHAVPAVLYFHGGGLASGDKRSWLPTWFIDDAIDEGWVFVSADYRLVPPAAAHDLLQDALAALDYVRSLPEIDASRVVVSGTSAGGLLAQLAALHASVAPVALVIMYGLGMRLSDPFWHTPYTHRAHPDMPPLDPADFADYLPPSYRHLAPTSGVPVPAGKQKPPRALLCPLYMRMGCWLDIIFHQDGLSEALRGSPARQVLTAEQASLFPDLHAAAAFPPTYIIQGESDVVVPAADARALHARLKAAGVLTELIVAPGEGHAFDYVPEARRYTEGCVPWLVEIMRGIPRGPLTQARDGHGEPSHREGKGDDNMYSAGAGEVAYSTSDH